MAVTDFNSNEWHNSDGLLVRFGTNEATVGRAGVYADVTAGRHCAQFVVDLVALSALSTFGSDIDVILSDTVVIPADVIVDEVVITVLEASAGASATLNLGTYQLDRATAIDADGLLVASTTGWHTAAIGYRKSITLGGDEDGADMGQLTTLPGLVTAQVDGAAYTAGVIKIQIFYFRPLAADLTSP
jgi:hypothetical protein